MLRRFLDTQAGRLYFLLDADYAERRRLFRRWLEGDGLALMDLGGGKGIWTRELVEGRREAVLVDHELEGYEGSRARAQRRLQGFPQFRAVDADVCATGLAAGSFERILCTEVLEHVPDPQALVREIARLLAPGGRAVLTTPSSDHLGRVRFGFSALFRRLPKALQRDYVQEGFEEHFRRTAGHLVLGYSWSQLEGFAAKAGLKVVHRRSIAHGLLTQFYDLLNCLPPLAAKALLPLSWPLWLLEALLYRDDAPGIGAFLVLEK